MSANCYDMISWIAARLKQLEDFVKDKMYTVYINFCRGPAEPSLTGINSMKSLNF